MIDKFTINTKKDQAVASPSTKKIFMVDRSKILKIIKKNDFIQQWLEVYSYAKETYRTFIPQLRSLHYSETTQPRRLEQITETH